MIVLTATGDRHESFAMCEHFMARQTYQDFFWVVVDDGKTPTEVKLKQEYIRRPPSESPRESFRNNMLTLLGWADRHEIIVFIEDDDWYSEDYLKNVSQAFQERSGIHIYGSAGARYYNVRHRMWKVHQNKTHASLCQTAFTGNLVLGKAMEFLRHGDRPETLDGTLWKRSGLPQRIMHLLPESEDVVGIKGIPGRQGLGIDHDTRADLQKKGYASDSCMCKLKSWIGKEDRELYRGFREEAE